MTITLRTALTAARARRTVRHLAGVGFRDGRAQAGDRAARAAERRRPIRLTAVTPAR
ncbi:hypothetical protein ACVV2G_29875 [Streptomyces ziwulingensis]